MFLEIALLTVASLIFVWGYLSQQRPKGFPPGPYGVPFLGNLPFMGNEPHKTLIKYGEKYGDVFSVYYGSYPIVVLHSYPIIKEAFRKDIFSGRPNHLLAMKLSKDGITFNDGPDGYEQRRFTLKTLRDFGFGKDSMEKLVQDEVKDLIEYFHTQKESVIEIKHIFGLFVVNALWAILAGEKFSFRDNRIQELYRLCIEGFIDPPVAGSLWFLPTLAKLMPEKSGLNSVIKAIKDIKTLFREVVEEHKQTFHGGHPRDFIDVYLEKVFATTDPNSSFYKEVGENNLVHVLLDLFTAGSDTLNSSLNFAIRYLILHEDVLERMRMEIDSVVGRNKLPSSNDRKQMPYSEAVICEVLRHSSIVCGAILHSTTENTTIGPYTLPKGTIVMPNLYHVHHSKVVWGDPEVFRPERFLIESKTARGLHKYTFVKNENLIPFSTGKRVCIAENVAQAELFIFLTGLVQNFNFKFPPNEASREEDIAPGLVLSPTAYKIILTDRE